MSSAEHRAKADAEPTLQDETQLPKNAQDLIEQILEQTLAESRHDSARERQEFESLLEVARRHAADGLALHPVGVELVGTILHSRFSHFQLPPAYMNDMARQIAMSLFDDPRSRGRILTLWNRLVEVLG